MHESVPIIVAVVTIFAGQGFWSWLGNRGEKKNAVTKMVVGVTHTMIIDQAKDAIERGYLTLDEYEDFRKYLWDPYTKLGGNGLAERMFLEMQKLPILTPNQVQIKLKEEQHVAYVNP